MSGLLPVCVLAGGLGTRLGGLTKTIPKALVDVDGEPFLLHQLRDLDAQGITEVVLCVGYLGQQIEDAIGARQGRISIAYSYDGPGLDGTLGAIRRAAPLLGERFFVLYGDTILDVDYVRTLGEWDAAGTPAMMTVLRNEGRWDTSNAVCVGNLVVAYDKFEPTPAMAWIDYGLTGLHRSLLTRCPDRSDLAWLWNDLASSGLLAAVPVANRFYEVGTPTALEETRAFLEARRRKHGG